MWLPAEPRREGEGAAPARLALHRDRPAHQGHQAGGDRQSQAGAAVLARRRGVLLLKGAEDLILLVRWDANAGVRHFKAQLNCRLRLGVRWRQAASGNAYDDLALLGELDGVAHQIEQHLPQPARVADQGVGHVGLDVAGQLQPLLVGAHGQGPQRVADRRPHGEGGSEVAAQKAGHPHPKPRVLAEAPHAADSMGLVGQQDQDTPQVAAVKLAVTVDLVGTFRYANTYGVAVALALSRLYLGLHYPSDVLAGIALGSAFGELAS